MASLASPPLPPDIQDQQQPRESATAQLAGRGGPPGGSQMNQEVMMTLASDVGQLEEITAKIFNQLSAAAPDLKALIQPIAAAGAALKREISQRAQKSQGAVGSASPGGGRAPGAPMPGSVLAAGNQGS